MKFFLQIFSIFFFVQIGFSQNYKGVIYDKENKTPIPFANVYTTQKTGVITNVEGRFSIHIKDLTEKDSLIISSLGYRTKRFLKSRLSSLDTIYLTTERQLLDEVIVSTNNLSALDIINRFKDSVNLRHHLKPSKFTIFYRNKQTYQPQKSVVELDKSSFMSRAKRKLFNDNTSSYFEKIKGKTSTTFQDRLYHQYYLIDSSSIKHVKYTKLVNQENDNSTEKIQENIFKELLDVLDTESTFKVRTSIITIEDSLSTSDFMERNDPNKKDTIFNEYTKKRNDIIGKSQILSKLEFFEDTKKYKYTLESTSFFNGDIVYIVSFTPEKNAAKYEGKAYIHAEDFGLLKLDYSLIEGKKEFGINLKLLLGVKFRADKSSYQYIFKPNEDKTYLPAFYRSSIHTYVYFDRSFVFKENNENKKERIKFKLSLLAETNTLSEEEFVIINTDTLNPDNFTFDEKGYIFLEKIDTYDPEIWKDYNILEATEEIKKYN